MLLTTERSKIVIVPWQCLWCCYQSTWFIVECRFSIQWPTTLRPSQPTWIV